MYGPDSQRRGGSNGATPRLPPPLPGPPARQTFPKSLSDKYRLGEELGRGAFGQVYLGLDTRTGQHVAIKQLSLERIPTDSLQGIMNEVELLRALRHRNIVTYIGSFKSSTHLYIILEFMENGALSSVIKASKFGPFPESLVAVYIQQVLQGLAYLHDQGVVHRDIKGANILTTKDGLVKLADFGVAAKLVELEAEGQSGREATPVGTPYWMAPEVVELKSVTTASDIWSVGCLAVELLTGAPPYYELQPMSALYNIVQDPHPPLPQGISSGFRDFLLQCFQKDPAARPTARHLLQHSWITFNRRTLKSSWSRTRGLRARGGSGPLAEGYTSVSTVVERILQSGASEAEGGGGGGGGGTPASQGGSSSAGSGAAAAAGTSDAAPIAAGGLTSGLGALMGLGVAAAAAAAAPAAVAAAADAPSASAATFPSASGTVVGSSGSPPDSLAAWDTQRGGRGGGGSPNGGAEPHRSTFSVASALGGRPPAFGSVVSVAT